MIGIVLVTHGNLAREFLAALEHVVGPQQCISAVCIGAEDDMEKRRSEILERARACDTGDGVIGASTCSTPRLSHLVMEQAPQCEVDGWRQPAGEHDDAVPGVTGPRPFQDLAASLFHVVFGADTDRRYALLRTDDVFQRCQEFARQIAVGHEYDADHPPLPELLSATCPPRASVSRWERVTERPAFRNSPPAVLATATERWRPPVQPIAMVR